jgi:hypothetical protein
MSDQSTYSVVLVDDTSAAARSASQSLLDLKSKIDADTRALTSLQATMKRLKDTGGASASELRRLSRDADKLKESIAADKGAMGDLQKQMKQTGAAAGGTSHDMEKLIVASRRLPGPLGGIGAALDGIVKLVVGGGPIAAGILVIAAAATVLAGGLVVATAGLLRYAIAQSDARRSELLHLEGMASLHDGYAASTAHARASQDAVDRVTDSYALSRTEILGLADNLLRAGVSAGAFEARLNHAASVAARRKFGGDFAAALLGLDVQADKAREHVGRIFSGLNLDRLLRGLNDVLSLLSQQTATGRALKEIVDTVFQPMVDALGTVGPVARRFFQGLVIGALQLLIAVDDLRFLFRRTFGSVDVLSGIDAQNTALDAGQVVIYSVVAGLVVLGAALAAVVVAGAAIAAPFVIAAAAVGGVIYALVKAYDYVASLQGIFRDAGNAAVAGLVDGLRRGVDAVAAPVRDIARAARDTLADTLAIHSPSRVFADLGEEIPRGLAAGIDAAAPVAGAAVAAMAPRPGAGGGTGAPSSLSLSIGELHVHTAATDARGISTDLRAELATVLEGLLAEFGREPTT